ncbi:hypothetical protein GALL_427470 [mine drainage metagenome]|uniref:Uncharacterized protein n=1 Tax=mine drainage metagenome TaxID=410659 RepID=A0A1J5PVI2_9ZZZZ
MHQHAVVGVGAVREDVPCEHRDLTAGEAGHQGIQVAGHGRQPAIATTLHQAVGPGGLHHRKEWSARRIAFPEIGAHGRGETTDTGLHEDMGWPCPDLAHGLLDHQLVALHHVPGHVHVTRIGRVRDHEPPIGVGVARSLPHGVVVVARSADDTCAEALYGPLAHPADAGMDVDHAPAPEQLRPPGDRAAVVAIGGAGHGDVRTRLANVLA